eukprot:TRINITY_DN12377_c0_g1_i1.p2 TRINITY_DN12377_c0_g1~~TRINITY_DN12377_c0_g1_i1.p2  ORF type:complete len:183 (+),score=16.28 TRINITY_DN12377_c0_g1_i1:111-659(+)
MHRCLRPPNVLLQQQRHWVGLRHAGLPEWRSSERKYRIQFLSDWHALYGQLPLPGECHETADAAARWLAHQRILYRDELLHPAIASDLVAVPGALPPLSEDFPLPPDANACTTRDTDVEVAAALRGVAALVDFTTRHGRLPVFGDGPSVARLSRLTTWLRSEFWAGRLPPVVVAAVEGPLLL